MTRCLALAAVICVGLTACETKSLIDAGIQFEKNKKSQFDLELSASMAAKEHIKRFLKYPNEASFPVLSPYIVHLPATNVYQLSSTVKTKNVSGTELTYEWTVQMKYEYNQWTLLSAAIDGESVYTAEGATLQMVDEAVVKRERSEDVAEKIRHAYGNRKIYPLRDWMDVNGKHKAKARFHSIANNHVKLVRDDGTYVNLPLDKLSPVDLEWIANRKR
ncbi:MAG: hypothetical protein JW829_03685 [Pirellulales bacterium]|nr:hypothetical protein [Pirellulales bacterium]